MTSLLTRIATEKRAIVLPLLGFDVAWGIESHAPEYYFELGLTDF